MENLKELLKLYVEYKQAYLLFEKLFLKTTTLKTDVWAMGTILLQMRTGLIPKDFFLLFIRPPKTRRI
jgi:hypothetical protein